MDAVSAELNHPELNQLLPIPQLGCTWIKQKSENYNKPCSEQEVLTLLRRMRQNLEFCQAPTTMSCNSFFEQTCSRLDNGLTSQAQSKGQVLILHFLGRWQCLSWKHPTSPLSGNPFVLPIPGKLVMLYFFPPPHKERNKGQQSLMAQDWRIWGLVYYMLNRALNYWWLLPSLTAFLKRETWANKHASWKSPYSDRSWQEKKHPGVTTGD